MSLFKHKHTPAPAPGASAAPPTEAPRSLALLVTVVPRPKTEFYLDLLGQYEVNLQTVLSAEGTAGADILALLGLDDASRSVILSVIREDRAEGALEGLEERFRTVRNGKGIAFTVPLSSTIGVAIYRFLSNTPA